MKHTTSKRPGDLTFNIGKCQRGKYPVTLSKKNKVLFAGRVDPHDSKSVDAFIKDATAKYKMLPVADIQARLLQLAAPRKELPPIDEPSDRYGVDELGLYYNKPTKDGDTRVQLTNFYAKIVTDVSRDDGAESVRVFEIEAILNGTTHNFMVPAVEFPKMDWPLKELGARAVVEPGQGLRDRARAAIQVLSKKIAVRTIFQHTGWREIDDCWLYLHAGGAIGHRGAVSGVEVDLPQALDNFKLPDPPTGEDLRQAIKASLQMLDVAPDEVTVPIFAAAYRAPLGHCDGSVFMSGPTGAMKSELTALGQQHFGPMMSRLGLPANWSSTDNALEGSCFAAKDALLVIDDFAPGGTMADVQRLHQRADRVFRNQGNHAGRHRMRPDGTLRAPRPPRGMVVSSGEDLPRGQSLRARLFSIDVRPGDVDKDRLTACQADAMAGRYAAAMAGYIKWLAPQMPRLREAFALRLKELRQEASCELNHARTPELVANLTIGVETFIQFARAVKAITSNEAKQLSARCRDSLLRAARRQSAFHAAQEPATRFMEILSSAVSSGAAHLAAPNGAEPRFPAPCGWRSKKVGAGTSEREEWQASGARVGWCEGETIYLDPDAAYKVVLNAATGVEGINVSLQTLKKRLAEKGLIVRPDDRDELVMRRRLEGAERRVLQLRPGALVDFGVNPSQSRTGSPDASGNTNGNGPLGGGHSHGATAEPAPCSRASVMPPDDD